MGDVVIVNVDDDVITVVDIICCDTVTITHTTTSGLFRAPLEAALFRLSTVCDTNPPFLAPLVHPTRLSMHPSKQQVPIVYMSPLHHV
jgi:hypothetical protein